MSGPELPFEAKVALWVAAWILAMAAFALLAFVL